jgi:hypothetical protein
MKRYLVPSLVFLLSISAFAQTLPTATIAGKVTTDGVGLPGVTVTVTSPNLQGARTTVTTAQGDYIVPFLPPGEYTVRYELSGMRTITQKVTLTAARTNSIDITLRPETVAESITVTATAPSVVETTQVSTNFNQALIDELPVPRNLQAVTLLAPGVNPNGPGGNLIISGAMSFDSLYLVNGAVVNENLRGQAHDLFIEDAIQETTVMTAGISAEYGHFTGGVVNAITKSGGNEFAGSFRTSLSNESWTAETEFTEAQEDKINPVYEATIGGPIMRDRIWFFGAGRFAETEDIRQTVPGLARAGDQDANGNPLTVGTQITPITYPHSNEETRLEGKVTGSITSKHSVVASYLDIAETETNQTGQSIMDLDSLVAARETPNTMLAVNYSGVLTEKLFIEGQYSKKDFAFLNSGSPYFDNIKGTLITDRARGTRYWSPTFRASPGGEQRDIEVYTLKGTYFLSTPSFGSHEIKVGYEDFNEVRKVNNYQNGSEFRISVPNTIVRGSTIYPRMPGGASGTLTRISWLPIFVLSQGSDYTTRSVFLNDRWTLSDHFSFNLGVRYDKNDALSGARTFKIADDAAFSPRLAAQYDVMANGRLVLNATYGEYVGRLAEGAANDADPAGRNASFQWNYRGPSINNDVNAPTSSLIPTDEAIRRVLDWLFANGGTSLRPFRTTPSVPGVESVLDLDGLKSPMVKEMSLGVASAIGSRGYVRADLILRNWDNFYTSYRNGTTGQVNDDFGTTYDLSIIRSDNEVYDREYTGVQTQFSYRLLERLNIGGTYTWSRLVGNVTGEDSGSGPLVGVAGEYPEYRREEWNYPTGYLTGDQRNRAKIWAAYDIPSPVGDFNISLLQNFDSANRTSADGDIDPGPYVTNGPDYLDPPATVGYFFGGRGNLTTDDIFRTDLALNYRLNLPAGVQLFVQPEVINIFNAQGVTAYDEEILTNVDDDDLAPFNPFTETPVEGVHWRKGPNFGKPNSEGDFQTPRTFRVSVGLRF